MSWRLHDGMKPSLVLMISLDEAEPCIWRRIRIPKSMPLERLHRVLQKLFGWQDYHLHHFLHQGQEYQPAEMAEEADWSDPEPYEGIQVGHLLRKRGESMQYCYDYGDGWEVTLQVEELSDDPSAEVLAGERAGPPEDCGGIPGLEELIEILADPGHPEYAERRQWAGKGYRPERFSVSACNGALFRKAKKKVKVQPGTSIPEDFIPCGPRLESYDLTALKTKDLMVAALVERGEPMSLAQLCARIQASGFPLEGVERLRKAWRQDPIMRLRQDGRLELDPFHPEYWRHEVNLREAQIAFLTRDPQRPTWEELKSAAHGLSGAQKKCLAVDAMGGASPTELDEKLAELGLPRTASKALFQDADGRIYADPASRALQEARRQLRRCLLRGEALDRREPDEAYLAALRQLPRYLVAWDAEGALVRELTSLEQRSYTREQLTDLLREARIVFAPDVFRLYEELGVLATRDTRRFDLMPFAYQPGGPSRQYPAGTTLEDVIQATLGRCYRRDAALSEKMAYYQRFLDYGRLHGRVAQEVMVAWNPVGPATLPIILRNAAACQGTISVSLDPKDPLQPELDLQDMQVLQYDWYDRTVFACLRGAQPRAFLVAHIHLCHGDAFSEEKGPRYRHIDRGVTLTPA